VRSADRSGSPQPASNDSPGRQPDEREAPFDEHGRDLASRAGPRDGLLEEPLSAQLVGSEGRVTPSRKGSTVGAAVPHPLLKRGADVLAVVKPDEGGLSGFLLQDDS
jgi:hypothetical protein